MPKKKRGCCKIWLMCFALFYSVASQENSLLVYAEEATKEIVVYPCGFPVGIYLKTEGLLVVGTIPVNDQNGQFFYPAKNKVEQGDYLVKVNEIVIESKKQLQDYVRCCAGATLTFTIRRDGNYREETMTPIQAVNGTYCLGIWVKEDTQGIGTMTYLTDTGVFGALGHPISDCDTGKMVEAKAGSLYETKLNRIVKAQKGIPGSVIGMICYENNAYLGTVETNQVCGVFGTMSKEHTKLEELTPCLPASKDEVTCGEAVIRSCFEGEPKEYPIEIVRLRTNKEDTDGFLFCVKDEHLLDITGGIIQGMSGSPILQNGKLIGAVTHVVVNEPQKGYGIFIDEMLENQENKENRRKIKD